RLRAHSAKRTATGGAGAGTPLTPALSPGERERQSALSAQNATAPPEDAGKLSPLPEGEGQGEGEAATSTPPTPSPAEDLRAVFQVVLGASLEVRSAVVYASFIVALVFLPV